MRLWRDRCIARPVERFPCLAHRVDRMSYEEIVSEVVLRRSVIENFIKRVKTITRFTK